MGLDRPAEDRRTGADKTNEFALRATAVQRAVVAGLPYVAIAAAAWKLTHGLAGVLDLGLFDESHYLRYGARLAVDGPPPAEVAPLYAVWYWLLGLLQPDRIRLYYLNYQVLAALLPMAIYHVVRRYGACVSWSLSAAFLFLVSFANVPVWPKVSHFAVLPILAALALAARIGSRSSRLAVLTVGALVAAYARPEFYLAFVLLAGSGAIAMALDRRVVDRREALAAVLLVALAAVGSGIWAGVPVAGGRSALAFSQHFARHWLEWTGSPGSPWSDWAAIAEESFGSAVGVIGAAKARPDLFSRHVVSNVVGTPKPLFGMACYHAGIVLPAGYETAEAVGLAVLLLAGAVRFRKVLGRRARERLATRRDTVAGVACLAVPPLLSAAVIWPRHHYLLPLTVVGLVLVVVLTARVDRERETRATSALLGSVILLAATPALPAFVASADGRPNALTVQFLRGMDFTRPGVILEAEGGLDVYLGDGWRSVPEYAKSAGESFQEFRAAQGIDVVVLSERLMGYGGLANDPAWGAFVADPEGAGFVKWAVPGTDRTVLVERGLVGSGVVPARRAASP